MPNKTSTFCRELLPPALTFYQRELGELTRPDRRGWARPKTGCPFHSSESKKSFYVHIDGGFYCFGCDAKGGDVLAFTRLRYKLSFIDAAKELGAWRQVTEVDRQAIHKRENEREQKHAEELTRLAAERSERIGARDHLHAVEALYREAIQEHDWTLLSGLLPRVREAEEVYCRLAGLEVSH